MRLLALTAAHPERSFEATTVGRGERDATVAVARLPPLGGDRDSRGEAAMAHLTALVDLYDRGMREPLPLYCLSSAAYAEAALRGRDAVAAGRHAWTSDWNFDNEDRDLEHQLVLGGVSSFDELLVQAPRPDEHGAGWEPAESTRLGRYARRMWEGLLACEQVTSA